MIPVVVAAIGLAVIADGGDNKLWMKFITEESDPRSSLQSWKVEVYEGNTIIGRGHRTSWDEKYSPRSWSGNLCSAAAEAMLEAEQSIWDATGLRKDAHGEIRVDVQRNFHRIIPRSPMVVDIHSRLYAAFMAMPISPHEDQAQVKRSLIRSGWFIEDLLYLLGEGLSADVSSEGLRVYTGDRVIGSYPNVDGGNAGYHALREAKQEGNWTQEELHDIVIGAMVRAGKKPIDYRGLARDLGWAW